MQSVELCLPYEIKPSGLIRVSAATGGRATACIRGRRTSHGVKRQLLRCPDAYLSGTVHTLPASHAWVQSAKATHQALPRTGRTCSITAAPCQRQLERSRALLLCAGGQAARPPAVCGVHPQEAAKSSSSIAAGTLFLTPAGAMWQAAMAVRRSAAWWQSFPRLSHNKHLTPSGPCRSGGRNGSTSSSLAQATVAVSNACSLGLVALRQTMHPHSGGGANGDALNGDAEYSGGSGQGAHVDVVAVDTR